MLFFTDYHVNGDLYTTAVYARDKDHFLEVIARRNMDEELAVGEFSVPAFASDLILSGEYAKAMHAACWLGMVACSSGVTDGWNLLHDQALIHTIAHLLSLYPPDEFLPQNMSHKMHFNILRAYWNALKLEAIVPGFQRGDLAPALTEKQAQTLKQMEHAVKHMWPAWYRDNMPEGYVEQL